MSSYDEILGQVPVDELAQRFGVDRTEIEQATESALPALLGGLQANASDPAAARSLLGALPDHEAQVNGLADIDEDDGRRIVGNIFGDNTDRVVNQLGGSGGSGGLVSKLLPILAPIVLSWLANRIGQGGLGGLGGMFGGGASEDTDTSATGVDSGPLFPGGVGAGSGPVQQPPGTGATDGQGTSSSGSNPLQDILGQVLGGATSGATEAGGPNDVLGGLLGGLLGGGKR